jgi:hypothetical protein
MGTLSCLQIQSYQFKGWAAVSHRSFLVSSVIDIPNHQRLLSLTATLSFCSFRSIMNSKTPYDIEGNSSSSEADFFLDSVAPIQRHPRRVGHLLWHAFLLLLAAGWLIPLLEAHSPCSKSNDWGRPEKTPLPSEVFGPVSKAFLPDDRYIGRTQHITTGTILSRLMTRFTSQMEQNMACLRGHFHHSIILTRSETALQPFMLLPFYTSCIAWYVVDKFWTSIPEVL